MCSSYDLMTPRLLLVAVTRHDDDDDYDDDDDSEFKEKAPKHSPH